LRDGLGDVEAGAGGGGGITTLADRLALRVGLAVAVGLGIVAGDWATDGLSLVW
jgi:hypothetical protein